MGYSYCIFMLTLFYFSSPQLNNETSDKTSTDGSTPKPPTVKPMNGASPEMVPSYGKLIKSFMEKKNKLGPGLWNKENGESVKEKVSYTSRSFIDLT